MHSRSLAPGIDVGVSSSSPTAPPFSSFQRSAFVAPCVRSTSCETCDALSRQSASGTRGQGLGTCAGRVVDVVELGGIVEDAVELVVGTAVDDVVVLVVGAFVVLVLVEDVVDDVVLLVVDVVGRVVELDVVEELLVDDVVELVVDEVVVDDGRVVEDVVELVVGTVVDDVVLVDDSLDVLVLEDVVDDVVVLVAGLVVLVDVELEVEVLEPVEQSRAQLTDVSLPLQTPSPQHALTGVTVQSGPHRVTSQPIGFVPAFPQQ